MALCDCEPRGILVVEDHGTVRDVLLDMIGLAFPDQPVRCASSVHEALALCRESMPEIAVLDIVLPDANGFAALAELRRLHEGVQVVIHSAFDDPVFRREAARLGAAAFVSKRDWNELIPAIARVRRLAHPWRTPGTPRAGFLADGDGRDS